MSSSAASPPAAPAAPGEDSTSTAGGGGEGSAGAGGGEAPSPAWKGIGSACGEGTREQNLLQAFQRRSLIHTAFQSSELEGTLPAGVSKFDTFRAVELLLDEPQGGGPGDVEPWPCEGVEGTRGTAQQITQHVRALSYLRAQRMWDFNASMVIEAHKILLEGAVEDSGVDAENGTLRTVDVHAGSHEFPSLKPAELLVVLDKVCAEFLRGLVCAEEHPVVTAAKLAQGVVALHPFRNGNGRLCRMLFVVALMWQGVPFGVTLTSGKSRARKHYVEALKRAQNSMSADGFHSLYYLSLFSVCEVLGNFASSLTALRIATTGV